jgi:hypothetical protein
MTPENQMRLRHIVQSATALIDHAWRGDWSYVRYLGTTIAYIAEAMEKEKTG